MTKKENPTPRANAGRAEDICCRRDYIEKPLNLEADFASCQRKVRMSPFSAS